MSNIEPLAPLPTSEHAAAIAALDQAEMELAATALGIDQRRAKTIRAPRLGRKDRHRILNAKIKAAGVRSAAGLAQRK